LIAFESLAKICFSFFGQFFNASRGNFDKSPIELEGEAEILNLHLDPRSSSNVPGIFHFWEKSRRVFDENLDFLLTEKHLFTCVFFLFNLIKFENSATMKRNFSMILSGFCSFFQTPMLANNVQGYNPDVFDIPYFEQSEKLPEVNNESKYNWGDLFAIVSSSFKFLCLERKRNVFFFQKLWELIKYF
jgi:hypothetical protein